MAIDCIGTNQGKYLMIVTEEPDEIDSYENLSEYAEAPWEGLLNAILIGNSADDFLSCDVEGLFYQLYSLTTHERISYGSVDPDRLEEEIEDYEIEHRNIKI